MEHVARTREKRKSHEILVVRPEGKRLLEIHRHSWEDNIRVDVRKQGGKM
jgi:hypothetical protein